MHLLALVGHSLADSGTNIVLFGEQNQAGPKAHLFRADHNPAMAVFRRVLDRGRA